MVWQPEDSPQNKEIQVLADGSENTEALNVLKNGKEHQNDTTVLRDICKARATPQFFSFKKSAFFGERQCTQPQLIRGWITIGLLCSRQFCFLYL